MAKWISENDDSLKKTIISATPVIRNEAPPLQNAIPTTAPIKPNQTDANREMTKEQDAYSSPSFIQRHALVILASAAAVCLAILVGTAVAVLAPAEQPDQFGSVATKGALDGPATSSSNSSALSETTGKLSPSLSPVKSGREQEFFANPPEKIDMNKALEEAKAKLQAGEIGKGDQPDGQPATDQAPAQPTDATQPPEADVAIAEAPNNTELETPVDPPATEPVANVEKPVEPPTEVTDPPKSEEVSADAVVTNPATVTNPAPEKIELTEDQLANPFQDMPRAADLGDINSTEPKELGKVYIPENILMACELITGREISRSKFIFELERSTTDKQRWYVNYLKRKNAPPERVGSFFRKDGTFNFHWEPTAAQNDSFNYIRNCVLKLTGHDQSTQFVYLRTAVPVEGLAISSEQGLAQVESSLEWLPNPDYLFIEVDLPSYQGVPRMYPIPATRQVTKKQPVNLVFSESAKNNYIYLQVSADFRKSLRLQLSLLFDPGNGHTQTIDEELLHKIVSQLSAIADTTALQSQQAESAERPPDVKAEDFNKFKSELKKTAELALSRKTSALNYHETIPKLYGKQIPLRVFFKLDNHEIVLAQSSEN